MSTYNRITGDYTLKTITPGSNVVLDTSNVTATGNITAPNFLGNIYANAFFYANGTPFSGGGGNAALPLANGTSNFNIATVNGNPTVTAAGNTWTFGGVQPDALYWPDGSFQATAFVGTATTAEGLSNVDNVLVTADALGNAYTWTFDTTGLMQIPGNIRATDYVDTSLYSVSNTAGAGTVELKVISFAGNVLGSNVRVTQSNATISTNNAEFTWVFDNTGELNLPGLTGHIASATDTLDIFSDVDEYNGITASTTATNILNQGNVGIVTSSGNANLAWTFDDTGNLTLPGNTFAVNYANGTPVDISGGSSTYGDSNVATLLSSFGSNTISTTGNVTAGFFTGNGAGLTGVIASGNVGTASQLANGTSSLNIPVADGNIIGNISGTANVLILSNTGLQINGEISASGNITGLNINSSNADLAEKYTADADYAAGTVVMFGGTAEVTECNQDACAQVAGVVSANPAYTMNSGLDSTHVAIVALVGRVPVRVQGPVHAGAMMVSAGNGAARAELNPAMGTVIGKAVHSFDGESGTIEIVVGRL
jgi:hypothetical protein